MALFINQDKFRLRPSAKPGECGYVQEEKKKDLIVLHFTAGSTSDGAFNSWVNSPIRIGTAYILDPNGTAYEIFDPKYYAFHLGFKGSYENDKRSVAIEIVNIGPLKRVGNELMCWPKNYKTHYCSLDEKDKYVEKSFRGFDYYASFSPRQLEALPKLIDMTSSRFNIPKMLPPKEQLEKFDPVWASKWKGIASHQNFRPDKFDIGPAFPWELLS